MSHELLCLRILHDTPVERERSHRYVVFLIEENNRPDAAAIGVIDLVERLPIPLVRIAAVADGAELRDDDRLVQLQQRRVRLLENLIEAPPSRP